MRIALLILFIAASDWWSPLFRPSNTSELTREGLEAWEKGSPAEARERFAAAAAIEPDAVHLYNAGTAALADGAIEDGSRLVQSAVEVDPTFGSDGFFNLGTALLRDQRLDDAIEGLKESLRRDPSRVDAKRNLELALQRRQQQQAGGGGESSQSSGGGGEDESPGAGEDSSGEQEGQEQQPGEPSQQPGRLDADAVLRAVAQQEAEELKRMREARMEAAKRGTGW